MIISSQICVSKLQRFFTLGDGCWLPRKPCSLDFRFIQHLCDRDCQGEGHTFVEDHGNRFHPELGRHIAKAEGHPAISSFLLIFTDQDVIDPTSPNPVDIRRSVAARNQYPLSILSPSRDGVCLFSVLHASSPISGSALPMPLKLFSAPRLSGPRAEKK